MSTNERAISSWDDLPVHQCSEYIRHPATSDRNFYDRYYFNLHPSGDDYFAIFGLGQYPNLGVTDAFVAVTHRGRQHIVRASRPLGDRADVAVGPISIEVLEPLRSLRVRVEPTTADDGIPTPVALDVTWTASQPPLEEPRQFLRSRGTVVFDTQRFAQLGRWEGTLTVDGTTHEVTPDRCGGSRDRSWGVRPVGEPQPDGIRRDLSVMAGMWNYFPVDFGDHAIVVLCHEQPDGTRPLSEALRVWADSQRPVEWLGSPSWEHETIPGTRLLAGSRITLPDAPEGPLVMTARPLLTNFVSLGTGYGMDADWRHGMWQGEELVVQTLTHEVDAIAPLAQYGVVDSVGRFEIGDRVGYGLYEHGFFGPFPALGLHERGDTFPAP